jgi:hypothetical protein
MTDSVSFIHELVAAVPLLALPLAQHQDEYEELLPHVFMGDVARFAIEQHQRLAAGATDSRTALETLFAVMERGAAEGSEDVKELISVSFLENLIEELTAPGDLRSYLGPMTRQELQSIFDFYGY